MKLSIQTFKKSAVFGVISGALAVPAANASVITAEVTDALNGIQTDVTTIGAILLVVAATAVAFKWVKGTLFM